MNARLRLTLLALLVAALAAPSLLAQPTPTPGPTNRYLGPNFPALVDSNGNGRPDPGVDAPGTPSGTGSSAVLSTPWDCGTSSPSRYYQFSNVGGDGRYQTVGRNTYGRSQSVSVAQSSAGVATAVQFEENLLPVPSRKGAAPAGSVPTATGSAAVVDRNGDGIYDGVAGGRTGGGLNFNLDLVLSDITSDGNPDYVSIPWSQSAALGVKPNYNCTPGTPSPQAWVPLADTNADGRPDSIVLDLNGDNIPDPTLFRSPILAPNPTGGAAMAPIPTLSQWGLVLLSAGMAAAGWAFLQKRGIAL